MSSSLLRSPAPFVAGSGSDSIFDFTEDPCEYFDLGKAKASTLSLSVLGEWFVCHWWRQRRLWRCLLIHHSRHLGPQFQWAYLVT